ncbi:acyltransferase family protein [Ammoniphilus resinae]|uniref:Surface polysaccharide O-acyltransferase-like enzyme n=1 Tax=Ammoniphilus resinae TaxID=861532 RepID=A0ABS4GPL0_9BACL|nr:acyltransferase family protein [Ammoniphilus resinae]MBP1932209.1 surface polysaccharide O-acyltransferase-like enzyme [Ammoniphilus resinae]
MGKRLYYLDYLRVLLTVLVILHHTAIAYGAGGSWIYVDVDQSELTFTGILLTLFTAINQSFFMGLFFFLSGYFTPGSYDRKGARVFLMDRLIRLGIPLLFYVFILGPIISYVAQSRDSMTLLNYYKTEVLTFHTIHIGPLWFVEALLLFAVIYVLIRLLTGWKLDVKAPTIRNLIVTAILLGISAFLLRLVSPVGEGVLGLQFGYFPSYIFLFISGVVAYRQKWLDTFLEKKELVKTWWWISLTAIPILPLGFILTGALEGNLSFEGGVNFQSFLYAMWEPFVAFGMILWLLYQFEKSVNQPHPFGGALADAAYTVFIIHPAIVVGLTLLLHGVLIPPLLKFMLVGFIGAAICFFCGYLITKIPFAKRVV